MGGTLQDVIAILMRWRGSENKTPLLRPLVSETRSFTSGPCRDPAHPRETIPEGCTAAKLSDALIELAVASNVDTKGQLQRETASLAWQITDLGIPCTSQFTAQTPDNRHETQVSAVVCVHSDG